jgi:hypothetical protein
MKTKQVSYTGNTLLNASLTVLVVLLVLAVGSHLYSTHFGGRGGGGGGGVMGGMGGTDGSQPVVYPPRQLPMMFGGVESGNGVAWPPDVLRNPYAAPMKDERYLVGPPMFPINVSTNPGAVDASYRQVGVLTPNWGSAHKRRMGNGEREMGNGGCQMCKKGMGKCDGACGGGGGGGGHSEDLLILMGRPLFTNRDTWQYYAISNQRNGVKLPVRVGGKNATNEYGVRELNGGDVITVDGYNKRYQVEMYETDTIRYLPYM